MQLSDDEWTRIDHLLRELWDLDPDERAAFLDEACDGEPAIRQKVEALLAAEDRAPDFLDGDAASFVGPAYGGDGVGAPPSHVGRRIGAYRLLEEVGRGGMSRVFRAERADGAYEQTVAVKLLRVGLDTEAARQRVRLERQVLATLDHPNIAGLLDGGLTDDDVPFLVMEYVEGRPITEYCDEHRCSVAERLRMLRAVTDALSYAHRNMVVHRDLKPSNILVTDDGQVKVLDFGIAKLLDAEKAGFTTPATRTGVRPMTPAYAAPEQVRGEAISAATDVYQWGVLAYELLTGRRPYEAGERSAFEVEQAVLEEDPARPSTVVGMPPPAAATEHRASDSESVSAARGTTSEALSRTLEGDLDAILLKALRKDPDARYASPDLLRADLERYEDGQPVQARSITPVYRLRKFARRHRAAVLAGAAGLFVVMAFVVTLFHQRSIALEERDRARTEAEKAQQISGFLVDLFEASNPMEETNTLTARALLRRGEQRVAALEDQPAAQAQLLDAMGQAHTGLGNYTTADSLLRRALSLRRRQADASGPSITAGLTHRARALRGRGRYVVAESLAREALDMRRARLGASHPKRAAALNEVGEAVERQSAYDRADSLYRRALSIYRADSAAGLGMAAVLENRGRVQREKGNYSAAESLHREALQLRRARMGPAHPETIGSLANLATTLEWQGDMAAADSLKRRVVERRRDVLGSDHPATVAARNGLGVLLRKNGRYAEAGSTFRAVLDHYERRHGLDHPRTAVTMSNLAQTLAARGRYAAADSLYQKARELHRRLFGADHPRVASLLNRIAALREKQGDDEAAVAQYREVLDRLRGTFGPEHGYVAITLGDLARAEGRRGRGDRADSLFDAALRRKRTAFGPEHPRVAATLVDRAAWRLRQGDTTRAVNLHQQALSLRRDTLGLRHPRTVESITALADVRKRQGALTAADSLYRKALALYRQALPKNDWRTAQIQTKLGACLVEQGRYATAESTLKDGLRVLLDQRGPSDEHTTETVRHLIALYETWGKPDSVLTYRRRLAATTIPE
ncbi:MAG: serine/threonine-protein kinase [Salinivenus sp.]